MSDATIIPITTTREPRREIPVRLRGSAPVRSAKPLLEFEQLPQRQDSTLDQLRDLVGVAERCGMYDAADYLRARVCGR